MPIDFRNLGSGGNSSNTVTTQSILTSYKFGLVPGDASDQTTKMQTFLDAWAAQKGFAILAPGDYICNLAALKFHHPADTSYARFALFAYGARITSTLNGVILGDDFPADSTAAAALLQRRLSIYGLSITGNAGASQTGIQLICRTWLHLEDMQVENCGTNYDLIFCLQGHVSACNSSVGTTFGYRCRSGAGLWTGASGPNSASNHMTFNEGTRDYATAGMTAQFYIEDSQGVAIQDCITEGFNPVNAIHYTTIIHDTIYGNTSGRTFSVRNHHSENFPTSSHCKIDAYSGHVIIDEFDSQTGGVLVDGTDSSITAVIVARLPTIPSSPAFKTSVGAARWQMDIPSNYGATDTRASALWVGAIVASQGGLRFNDSVAEAQVNAPSFGIAGGEPWLHGTDIRLISDRTTYNVPGIHLYGATELGVYDNGPVAGVFLANSMACPSLDISALNMLWTAKYSNGAVQFSWLPTVVQNLIGYLLTRKHAAPADADLVAGEMAIWFDQTVGAAKFMVKAKNSAGTVVTGSVNLT